MAAGGLSRPNLEDLGNIEKQDRQNPYSRAVWGMNKHSKVQTILNTLLSYGSKFKQGLKCSYWVSDKLIIRFSNKDRLRTGFQQ